MLQMGCHHGLHPAKNLIQNLHYLGSYTKGITRHGQREPAFPGILALLEQMTRGDGHNRIYSFNPTNLCSLIKMTLTDFT